MKTDEIQKRLVDQTGIVIDAAGEKFADSLKDFLRERGIDVAFHDLRDIENLFTNMVHTFVIAEMAAFVSFLLFSELKNEDILKHIVPDFLEACEGRLEKIPESLSIKTRDLKGLAQSLVVDTKQSKSSLVSSLANDIAEMEQLRHLRASFDAALLSFMGE